MMMVVEEEETMHPPLLLLLYSSPCECKALVPLSLSGCHPKHKQLIFFVIFKEEEIIGMVLLLGVFIFLLFKVLSNGCEKVGGSHSANVRVEIANQIRHWPFIKVFINVYSSYIKIG